MNLVLRDVIETVHSFQIRSLFQTEWRNLLITVHTPSNNKSQLSSQTITYTHSLYRIVCENLMLFLSSTLQGFEIWNVHRRRNGNLWRLSRYRSSLSLRFRTSLFFSDLFSFFSWVLKILFSLSENSDCYFFLLTLRLIASFGHEAQDMKTFADWGVDYIKVDFCYLCSYANQPQQPATTYAMFRDAILATNRSIIFRYQSIYFIHFISFHFIPVQFSSVLFCFVLFVC